MKTPTKASLQKENSQLFSKHSNLLHAFARVMATDSETILAARRAIRRFPQCSLFSDELSQAQLARALHDSAAKAWMDEQDYAEVRKIAAYLVRRHRALLRAVANNPRPTPLQIAA